MFLDSFKANEDVEKYRRIKGCLGFLFGGSLKDRMVKISELQTLKEVYIGLLMDLSNSSPN